MAAPALSEPLISFAEWKRLSPISQAAYLTGIIDAIYMDDLGEAGAGLSRCMRRQPRTPSQFAAGLIAAADAYEAKTPGFRYRSVAEALASYIGEGCP